MKTTIESNFRVTIEPRRLGDYGWAIVSDRMVSDNIAKEYRERCEEIVADAKRHCNNVGRAYVECDTEFRCSHCGRIWDESQDDSDPEWPKGKPLCCEAAIAEWEAGRPKPINAIDAKCAEFSGGGSPI